MAVQLQGKIQALASLERVAATLDGTTSFPAGDTSAQGGKVWTWRELVQELINLGQKYSRVKLVVRKPETCEVRYAIYPENVTYDSPPFQPGWAETSTHETGNLVTRLAKGILKRLMDGVSTNQLEQAESEWPDRMSEKPSAEKYNRNPDVPPLIELSRD